MNETESELKKVSKKERRRSFKQQTEQLSSSEMKKSLLVKSTLAVVVVITVAFFGYLWVNAKPAGTDANTLEGLKSLGNLKIGDQAPDFSLVAVDGKTFSLRQYKGSNVLLYFNEGVMCQPCWKQVGTMQKNIEKFKEIKTQVLTIAVDSPSTWAPILKAENITSIPVLVDTDRSVSQNYGVLNLPSQMHPDRPGHTYVLVDKTGKIAWMADFPTMRVADDQVIASIKTALEKQKVE